ncbi:LacI family transcriptional regulator [Tropicimonas sp. S265A]|uniref:LacI family transcriptional regulator n=1 Tax=Tropicimonas sp. S265A TaxID=3415134 RepID=UPI003C7E5B87
MASETEIPQPVKRTKPTLRTVAEATGFAVTTVSRALAGDERIAESTRLSVAEAAERVGYVPDRAAQRLRTGRTKVIGLLLNTDHEYLGFTNEFLSGITGALRGTGYAVTIVPDTVEEDRMAVVRNILRNRLADGIVFTRTECFDERVRFLLENDFPFVTHGRTDFTTPHPFVDYDNAAFARMAVERLAEKGRRHVCMILPDDRFTFAQHLRYGFMSAVREAGLEFTLPSGVDLDSSPDEIAETTRITLAGPDRPDGFICVGEVSALATLAALSDAGIAIGEAADVVAKRASPIFSQLRPRIETVFEDLRHTGFEAGELLLKRIDGADPLGLQVLHAPQARFRLSG